jgi:hypothetical protein
LPHSFAKQKNSLICLASVAAVMFAVDVARAQDCESMSGEPKSASGRTDCSIGRARVSGEKVAIAGTAARIRIDQERLRAVTGGTFNAKPRKAKLRHRKTHVE